MRRTALVTGAGSGLGALAARRLAAGDWDVVAVDADAAGLARTAERAPNVHTRVCDVTDAEAVRAVAAEAGGVHRMLHAAGIGPLRPAMEQDADEIERILHTNYLGTVNAVRAVLPGMLERGRGELVLFSSVAGVLPVPYSSAYAASKAAVNAYAEVLVQEHGGRGVKIRCVCPRHVDTPMLAAIVADGRYGPMTGRGALADRLGAPMPPHQVLDAVDRSLAGSDRDLYVLPGPLARGAALARRCAPGALRRALAGMGAG